MKIANTLWKDIRSVFSGHKMDRTWIFGGKLLIIMQHMQLVSTGNKGTTIELCTNSIQFINVVGPE